MNLLGKATDLSFWAEVKENPIYKTALDAVLRDYEKYCKGEIETTKFSKFRLFKDKGDRTSYQEVFFKRQHRLYAMSFMTMLYPENEEYLELLQDTIWEICDQYVWALPAHIENIEENNNCELDLDATTMAMALAMIKEMLKERLHPLIKSRIDCEIDRRLIKPFMAKRWHWEYRQNNWTAVCAGATGCAIMLNRPELFSLVQDRLNNDMASYISSYKDDGVCVEGAGYWSYGFGYFIEYAAMQREFTNGELDLLKDDKIREISTFLQKLFLDKSVIVNYGDCGVGADVTVPAGFMYGLKRLYPNDLQLPPADKLSIEVHYFPFAIRAFTCLDESFVAEDISDTAEYYMKDCGWFVKRTPAYGFSARGGCNGESHNHNDVGNFILSIDNESLLIDMGARPYTRQYFEHGTRYTYLETSSRGHNVPVINGKYQANIPEAYPTTSFENGVFSVDFKVAYDIPELKRLVRSFYFTDTSVTVCDSFKIEGECSFTERIVSYVKPTIGDGEISYGKATVKFDSSLATARVERDVHALELNTDGSLKKGLDVYLISIDVKEPKDSFTFTIEVK
ncbi:MAG: heparinase II/III family protein [Clostridia bacterium]|nr:heparinase II/III family protein [Clostridia bacterium]